MKNKTYVILTAICLLMTALSSALMSLSSGAAMNAYGALTLAVGAVCTFAAARLLRIQRTAESKPPVELVVCEALEGPATGRVSRRTEKFTNRISVTGRR